MRSMDMPASTTTETVADDQDEAYLAQRQSTMDSATLDKLLMAEKNLAQAGQATTNVWKLIGKLPSEEAESPPSNTHLSASVSMPMRQNSRSTTNFSASQGVNSSPRHTRTPTRRKISTQASEDMSTSRYASAGAHSPPNGNQWAATAPSGSRGELMIDTVDTANIEARGSPRYNMEIPRPDVSVGRSSLGSYASTQSNSFYERPVFAGAGARAMDTLSDSNNFLVENGRSRSTHSSNVFGFNRNAAPLSEVTLFTFTVKKSDSVLEKLGSKRASIQLQVDVDERMLYFLSAHDQREEYSCAAVTAKPQSRLGMQLKIQTNNASVNKKITFYSTEDRANFVQALEQGKVMVNKKTATAPTPSRPSRTPTEIIDETASTVSSTFERSKLRDSMVNDHFQLLPGESVLEHVQRVTNLVVMSQSDRAVQGVLKITSCELSLQPLSLIMLLVAHIPARTAKEWGNLLLRETGRKLNCRVGQQSQNGHSPRIVSVAGRTEFALSIFARTPSSSRKLQLWEQKPGGCNAAHTPTWRYSTDTCCLQSQRDEFEERWGPNLLEYLEMGSFATGFPASTYRPTHALVDRRTTTRREWVELVGPFRWGHAVSGITFKGSTHPTL